MDLAHQAEYDRPAPSRANAAFTKRAQQGENHGKKRCTEKSLTCMRSRIKLDALKCPQGLVKTKNSASNTKPCGGYSRVSLSSAVIGVTEKFDLDRTVTEGVFS